MEKTMDFSAGYEMTINGRGVGGSTTIDVVNPANGNPFAKAPDCTRDQLNEAVNTAKSAFKKWRQTPLAERQALVYKAGDRILKYADELAWLFTREQGRPVEGAKMEIVG